MTLSLLSTILLNGSSSVSLDPRRLALEASSADWFKWVTWYGYAVAFGCLMEAWEVSITLKTWAFIKYRGIEIEEDKKAGLVLLLQ